MGFFLAKKKPFVVWSSNSPIYRVNILVIQSIDCIYPDLKKTRVQRRCEYLLKETELPFLMNSYLEKITAPQILGLDIIVPNYEIGGVSVACYLGDLLEQQLPLLVET